MYEGGNFLALVSLMAEYDEFLAEVLSLPGRATKYLSAKIQNELIHLLANTLFLTLVENNNSFKIQTSGENPHQAHKFPH